MSELLAELWACAVRLWERIAFELQSFASLLDALADEAQHAPGHRHH